MAITLDETKKQMIICADEFFKRWGYAPTQQELQTMVKASKQKITPIGWEHDIIYLTECAGLLNKESGKVYVESHAMKSITEMDDIDA
jgi:hypothetical protein